MESSVPKGHDSKFCTKKFPMVRAMTIVDAKAAVDKDWEKLETIPAWQLDKSKD